MKKMINKVNVSGYLYQHTLEMKESGPKSANPGTVYITGNVDIATDAAMTNIVTIHYTYVTATTKNGKTNASFNILKDIIEQKLCNVITHGADKAAILSIGSAIGLNEFYSDRSGKEELVSAKRNEGGFISVLSALPDDETKFNSFDVDMVITRTFIREADEEKNLPEKMILSGCIFDFRNAMLPIDLSVINPAAISYFDSLGISQNTPVFTRLQGKVISEVIKTQKVEESAFGQPIVKEYSNTRKDYVITWAASEPYEWDSEESITAAEMKKIMEERATYLATVKARQDEYKASQGQAASTPAVGGFNF